MDAISSSPMVIRGLSEQKAKEVEKSALIRRVENIFPEHVYAGLAAKVKTFPAYSIRNSDETLYVFPSNTHYGHLTFDTLHGMDRAAFIARGTPNIAEITALVIPVVERFATEFKLIGSYSFQAHLYRTRYYPGDHGLESIQLGWHYDKYAKYSMVMVFQNDLPYQEGLGLDIAENAIAGPHCPWGSADCAPKAGFISCSYPENGALCFASRKGKIIHQRSQLGASYVKNASRTVLQLKFKNYAWKEDSCS